MPARYGTTRTLVYNTARNQLGVQEFDSGGLLASRDLALDERSMVANLGVNAARETMAREDELVNCPDEGPDYQSSFEDPIGVASDEPYPAPTPLRSRRQPPVPTVFRRDRAALLPANERSARIFSAFELYKEAVKKRIELWGLMEEISVALEQSLARTNRFDIEDSQIDGVAAGLDDASLASQLSVEEMCDALRIDHPDYCGGSVPS